MSQFTSDDFIRTIKIALQQALFDVMEAEIEKAVEEFRKQAKTRIAQAAVQIAGVTRLGMSNFGPEIIITLSLPKAKEGN
jgi:hypothetical protein